MCVCVSWVAGWGVAVVVMVEWGQRREEEDSEAGKQALEHRMCPHVMRIVHCTVLYRTVLHREPYLEMVLKLSYMYCLLLATTIAVGWVNPLEG